LGSTNPTNCCKNNEIIQTTIIKSQTLWSVRTIWRKILQGSALIIVLEVQIFNFRKYTPQQSIDEVHNLFILVSPQNEILPLRSTKNVREVHTSPLRTT
jgi:hypothetical protein